MTRILVTGATGNIGVELVNYLNKPNDEFETIVAVRNIERAKKTFHGLSHLTYAWFDFENPNSFDEAFDGIDILFLLRPPHISKVDKYFQPLLNSAKKKGIEKIVFLSVQGAEQSKVIPHNKIESLIKSFGFKFIFVRPSYFMQNLTTTLLPELIKHQSITLPAGQAKFNWIDIKNIGEVLAILMRDFDKFQNQAIEITGSENKNFLEVTEVMSRMVGTQFTYISVNPVRFYFKKRKEGVKSGFAVVMAMLHFLPRLQKEPEISNNFNIITGKKPTTLEEFIIREKAKITS